MFSCNQEDKSVQKQVTRETLNLNFDSNILSLSPYDAQTESEKFVRSLMFETLCNKDSSSRIFNSINISANELKYSFTIDTTRRFNNGGKVNSASIKDFLSQVITVSHENIYPVFNNIMGFKTTTNGLPEGIRFIDPSHMVIELKKPFDIITALSKDPFYLNKNGIGTGDYINIIADDDILFTLDRVNKVEQGVNHIQIRFIKNQKEMLNEFLNGKLDILKSNYLISDSSQIQSTLDDIIKDKYDGFNVSYLKSGYIIYSSIYDMYDSLTCSELSNNPKVDSLYQFQMNTALKDSSNNTTIQSSNKVLKLLVANKKHYYTTSTDYSDFIPKLNTLSDMNSDNLMGICVFSVIPDKYFYTNAISGLTPYKSLSEEITNIRFKPIIQF